MSETLLVELPYTPSALGALGASSTPDAPSALGASSAPDARRLEGVTLTAEVARLIARLADLVDELGGAARPLPGSAAFLRSLGAAHAAWREPAAPALQRLVTSLALSRRDLELILLAGVADEHEGVASILACLHPTGQPRASVGLAAQLFGDNTLGERSVLRRAVEAGAAVSSGALRVTGDAPLFNRTLELAPGLWSLLRGVDAWPPGAEPDPAPVVTAGLEEWLATAPCLRAAAALRRAERCVVLLLGDHVPSCVARAAALAAHAGVAGVRFAHEAAALLAPGIVAHLAARAAVPIVALAPREPGGASLDPIAALGRLPGPVIACARLGTARGSGGRAVVSVPVERMSGRARERLWRQALPTMTDHAGRLATTYPVEPEAAIAIAADVHTASILDDRAPTLDDVAAAVRARTHAATGAAVVLRRPVAGWDALVLPADRLRVLREAIDRLGSQTRVLDEWGFLGGRAGARGVRLLLAGPPGTGKTLAAEVLARALGVDLLIVDLARLVSKWLGDTEKHLAEVFDAAEQTQALLLFDEADALFGRRTEVSDAHDRYANMETAYLLARIERFEGLTVLSTNLKRNLDPAFLRRLEFVVELEEPALEARAELWRRHLPRSAPLHPEVDLTELAALYPIVGGLIRNAAVASGFLAASAGTAITRELLVHAVRREYQKAGRAFPGLPPDLTDRKEA